jgi:hypothetical protein
MEVIKHRFEPSQKTRVEVKLYFIRLKTRSMAKERKKYDKEFKLKIVEVSFLRKDVKGVAEEYGINPQQLSV